MVQHPALHLVSSGVLHAYGSTSWLCSLALMPCVQGHLEHTSTVRWPYAVADDFFTKQLPNNVTWLLTLMYSLDQTGAPRMVASLPFWRLCWPSACCHSSFATQQFGMQPAELASVSKTDCCKCSTAFEVLHDICSGMQPAVIIDTLKSASVGRANECPCAMPLQASEKPQKACQGIGREYRLPCQPISRPPACTQSPCMHIV
jgi:hypothetical protein